MASVSMEEPQFFKKRIVHLDLKGAAPRPEYLFELLPFFASLHFNGVLMEYEDTFPYGEELAVLARDSAYNASTIEQVIKLSTSLGMEVIPLVQTFGHMEFALKHAEFAELREAPVWSDTICPSKERSLWLIREMLKQIRSLHPHAKSIHIGSDEAWHVAEEELCMHRLATVFNGSKERLKMEHISKVARMAREEFGFGRVYAWNDMFDKTNVSLMKEYGLAELVIPVVWGYNRDVTTPGYFPDGLFRRYSQVFNEILFASAYKGANGITQQFMDIDRYMDNLVSYRALYHQNEEFLAGRLSGIVLTGWQRFAHHKPLCELLPMGLPTMVKQALYMANWDTHDPGDNRRMKNFLQCPPSIETATMINPRQEDSPNASQQHYLRSLEAEIAAGCRFPGAELYKAIEDIRFLHWKFLAARRNRAKDHRAEKGASEEEDEAKEEEAGGELERIEREYQQKRERIALLIGKYFHEETAREWIAQHPRIGHFRDDDPSVPRFQPK